MVQLVCVFFFLFFGGEGGGGVGGWGREREGHVGVK